MANVSDTYSNSLKTASASGNRTESFRAVLDSAMNMLSETNQSINDSEEAALDFSMGNSDNTHDLAIANQKALTAVQYTVAVRDAVMDAYKEIMQLQF